MSGMSPFYPLIILSAPSILIALSSLSLHQFKVLFITFVNAAAQKEGNFVWTKVQPFLNDLAHIMESILGRATGFSPNLTHVMLCAVLMGVIIGLERVRGAILDTKRAR
eukprot:CAMPEP_0197579516 /NCGR_PEP_ID=MMETSP1326-20131121/3513_1 /TAXON_ID=1155430 /ORGANISM="Genus nov. species nov., Strain RCC2288" /LENGTH=108 /DNA_ID=CAMNT_0043143007 /DNA_START=62 /DNA_END=388 /DNA_ORIENTATION=-